MLYNTFLEFSSPLNSAPRWRSSQTSDMNMNRCSRFLNRVILSCDSYCRKATTTARSIGRENALPRSPERQQGLRINRCFPQFSRTVADRLIESGRVTVNGERAKLGVRLQENDVVLLDQSPVQWHELVGKQTSSKYPEGLRNDNGFVYIKYWKDAGVNTTASPRDPDGIMNTGHFKNVKLPPAATVAGSNSSAKGTKEASENEDDVSRLLAVGRLDKQSTGVLLLTSDARLPAWLLGANTGCSKVYEVKLDRAPTAAHLQSWSKGITLSTPSSSGAATRTHPTLPCKVRLLAEPPIARTTSVPAEPGGCWVEFTLKEGRNRQIRRMVHSLGYTVLSLHRSTFCGVSAAGLRKPGEWAYLTDAELRLLQLRK